MYMYMVNKTNLNTTFLEFNASAVQITHTRNYMCENYLNVGESYVTLAKESAALLDFTAVLPNISAKKWYLECNLTKIHRDHQSTRNSLDRR